MTKPDFAYVIYIDTTPDQLWKALTEGEFTSQYWGGRQIKSDWTTGAPHKCSSIKGVQCFDDGSGAGIHYQTRKF